MPTHLKKQKCRPAAPQQKLTGDGSLTHFTTYGVQGRRPWRLIIEARSPLPWDYNMQTSELNAMLLLDAVGICEILLQGLPAGTIDRIATLLSQQNSRRKLAWKTAEGTTAEGTQDSDPDFVEEQTPLHEIEKDKERE